jgi:hypothetical protein
MWFQSLVTIVIAVRSIVIALVTTKIYGTQGYFIQQEALSINPSMLPLSNLAKIKSYYIVAHVELYMVPDFCQHCNCST